MARRVSSPAFVGRVEELEALTAALVRADAGEGATVLVGGESGVGKSRLVAEFERSALEAGARVLAGGCIALGGSELPYAPLVAALRTLVRETEPAALDELVGFARRELSRLLPELAGDRGEGAAVDPLAQARLFEGLLGMFARLARSAALVLLVEDLQWADASTRSFLSFLLRNARRERLLFVGSYRTDELHRRHPLRQFLADVEPVAGVERLELRPFTRRELAEQLAGIIGGAPEQRVVDELYARSQGNAFFAEELLAASAEGRGRGVPASLRDALIVRLGQLSPEAQSMLRTASAIGNLVPHELLGEVVGIQADELLAVVREAIEHNVLVPEFESGGYSFRHALMREALYEELLPGERGALHATLAQALARSAAPAAERATHWYAAHELGAALAASLEAGAEAAHALGFAEANAHYERAIELWGRVPEPERPRETSLVELVRRAAESAHFAGEPDRALALGRRALELVDAEREPAAAGRLHERLGRYELANGSPPAALEHYRAAARLVPDQPTAERASILAGEAHILMLQGDATRARELCEEAIAIARAVGAIAVQCNALNTLGPAVALLGAREEGARLLRDAKRLAEELGARDELVRAYVNLSETLDQAGELEEATAVALEGWQRLDTGAGSVVAVLAAEAGARLVRLGRWQEAGALLADATEATSDNAAAVLLLIVLGGLETLRGELELAAAHLERARALGERSGSLWTGEVAPRLAAVALAAGKPSEARALIRSVVDGKAEVVGDYAAFVLPNLATALAVEAAVAADARSGGDTGGAEEAAARAESLLARALTLLASDRWPLGGPPPEAQLLAELCRLETARARGRAAADEWAAHAVHCGRRSLPYRAAYARLREAEAALAEGLPRARVADALGEARSAAATLGALPLLHEIDDLARRSRTGGDADGPAGLTARELEVLRLLAAGKTNKEIATALFMSPKTASVHVSRILAKLDARTRTEAAGIAHRLGLTAQPA